MSAFEDLAKALFDGGTVAQDFKVLWGPGDADREAVCEALLASMMRVGIINGASQLNPDIR